MADFTMDVPDQGTFTLTGVASWSFSGNPWPHTQNTLTIEDASIDHHHGVWSDGTDNVTVRVWREPVSVPTTIGGTGTGAAGSSIVLTTTVEDDAVDVTWFKGLDTVEGENALTLTLAAVDINDAGEYTAAARTPFQISQRTEAKIVTVT